MRTKILLSALCAVMLAVSGCTTKVEATNDSKTDKNAIVKKIEAMEDAYAKAFNSRDIEGVLKYYAEDIQSFENGKKLDGKAALREEITRQMKMVPADMKISFKSDDIRVSSDGAQVVETGSFEAVGANNIKMQSGYFLSVFAKNGDKYECVREMISADVKPATE